MDRDPYPLAEVRVLASRALDLSQRHDVPPYPRAYEVWFTYVSGTNKALAERLDAAMEKHATLPKGLIDELYESYLSPSAVKAGVERIGDQMGEDLAEVVELVEVGSQHGQSLALKLERAEKAVNAAADPEQKKKLIAEAMRDTRHHIRAITRLGTGLESMRQQFLSMQSELRDLRQSVLMDELTQLPNRRYFDEALPRLVDAARTGNKRSSLALILIELVSFDAFIDRWGEKASDMVLIKIGSLMRSLLAEGDMAMRVSDHRFALIVQGRPPDPVAENLLGAIGDIRMVSTDTHRAVARVSAAAGTAVLTREDTCVSLRDRAAMALGGPSPLDYVSGL